jgi:hypothetical protein
MHLKKIVLIFGILLNTLSVSCGAAEVSLTEKLKLGNDLTPLGAVMAGNDDGSIPPWTGGIKSPPIEYKKGDHHPDPYSDDKILFTISRTNLDIHKDKLTPGQIALMKQYPSFKMNVYPTRRSASFPQRIYDATIANSKNARLSESGDTVSGAIMGIPFPVPKSGNEAIWNHLLRYRGDSVSVINNQAAVTMNGAYTLLKSEETWLFSYSKKGATLENFNNKIWYVIQEFKAPASMAGSLYLIHDPLNYIKEPRNSWGYFPGQRRVTRFPEFAYDIMPGPTEGLRSVDQYDMFNGAIDRYDWRLLGKRELYVPYNSYKLHSDKLRYKDILKPGHINTDYARYELHRVWVVDATVKKGMRHLYPRRTFYLDEDSWQILIIDIYSNRGKPWRISEGHVINYYEVPTIWTTLQAHYDLKSGRYYVNGVDNEERMYDFSIKREPSDFTPAALRRMGRR